MDPTSAGFVAWKDKEPTVNSLFEMDLSTCASLDSEGFDNFEASCRQALQGLLSYPSFRSVVVRNDEQARNSYVWKEVHDLDIAQHVHVHTASAEDPMADVLQHIVVLRDEYFDLNMPRWQARIYRYTDSASGVGAEKTRALFVLLRTGHMLADGVSLVSILLTSVLQSCGSPAAEPVAIAGPLAHSIDKDLQMARFDVSWPDMVALCADLKSAWNIQRVTATTLMHTVASRGLANVKGFGKNANLWIAMPTDKRGTALNKIKTTVEFNEQLKLFADPLRDWDPPNHVEGDAHKVAHLDPTHQDLSCWQDSYHILEKALQNPYMQPMRKFMDEFMTPRNKRRLTKAFGGTIDYMMSSMNAGPQHNSLGSCGVGTSTVFMYPTCCFERSIMLLRSGDRMGVGIAGPDAEALAEAMTSGLQSLRELVADWKSQCGRGPIADRRA